MQAVLSVYFTGNSFAHTSFPNSHTEDHQPTCIGFNALHSPLGVLGCLFGMRAVHSGDRAAATHEFFYYYGIDPWVS